MESDGPSHVERVLSFPTATVLKRFDIRYTLMVANAIVIAILALNTLLGTGIFLRNPRARANRLYAAFVFSVSVWIAANFLENEPTLVGLGSLDSFLRIDFAFAAIFFYLWFRFVSVFVANPLESPKYRWLRWAQLVATVPAFIVPFIDSALITNIQFSGTVITFENGPFWTYYANIINLYMFAGLSVLAWGWYASYREGNVVAHRQINYVFLSSALSLAIAMAVNLPQAVYPISLEVSRLGVYGMGFLVVFTAYAMARARFFEIKLTIARAIASLIMMMFSTAISTFILFRVAISVFRIPVDERLEVSVILIAVVISVCSGYISRTIERVTDRLFFKQRYNAAWLQKKIGKVLIETLELENLSTQIVSILHAELRLKAVALILETNRGVVWRTKGFPAGLPASLQSFLSSSRASLLTVFEDMEEGRDKELFRSCEISMTVPLRVKDQDVALLVFGPKLSGESFSEEDISFFEIVAPEIAIGVQNAKSVDDLRQLSRELEVRVADRTRELEESQQKEVAKAQEVARLKDEFVFLAVHELKTPIVAIRSFLEMTEAFQKRFPAAVKRNLEAISESSTNMSNIINDLLEIARSDTGSMKIDVSPHEFSPILDQVLHEVAPLMRQKEIVLETNIRHIPPILCDTQKVKEVVENLVSNAIKYNKPGGSIYINVFCPVGENHMIFEIRDTGYGIPKELQQKIFQKFFRAVTRDTQEVLGSGLGLFIARLLIERMGGSLMFSSVEHEGSTFAFTLPLAPKLEDPATPESD